MKQLIKDTLAASIETKQKCIEANIDLLIQAAHKIAASLQNNGKVLIFGNGGSAADAQHIAAEFVNRFQIERPPLAAIALTTDTSILTSIGNDYEFNEIFSKQVKALAQANDIVIGISTSGNSPNVIRAIDAAKEKGIFTIGWSGKGGQLKEICDMVFCVDSPTTARIQETHILIGHILCDLIDRCLFPETYV